MTDEPHDAAQRWRARPVLARTLRTFLLAAPLVASTAAVLVVIRLLPPGAGRTWWGLTTMLVTAIVVAVAMERGTRRLLPIALLLKLSMIFPDRAPSRLKLARSAAVRTPKNELLWNGTAAEPTSTSDLVLDLVAALGTHDRRTRGHSERVRLLCDMLAEEIKLDTDARDRLRWAALLHDVGKIKVSTSILNKPSRLDAREFDRVKSHPAAGAELAAPLLPWLGEWGDGILDHHEKYDGSGYPNGKAGVDISTAGRLIGLIDAFETMTAARPYKKAMATKAAREELARCAGSHFDPLMVRAFLAISLPRVMWAMGPLSFLFQLPFLRPLADAGVRAGATAPQAAAAALTSGAAGAAVIVSGGLGGVIAPGATGQAELYAPTLTSAPHSAPYSLQDRVRRTTPLQPVEPVEQVATAPAEADADPESAGQPASPAGSRATVTSPPAPDPAAPAEPAPAPVEKPAAVPAEEPAPAPAEEPAPAPAEEPAAAPAEEPAPAPAEEPAAAPAEEPAPAPAEEPAAAPAEEPAPAPADEPAPAPAPEEEPAPAPVEQDITDGTPVEEPVPAPVEQDITDGTPVDITDDTTVEEPTAPAPTTQISAGILDGPDDVVDSKTASFTFAPGTAWECQILANGVGGGSNYKPCTSPHEVTVLDVGTHRLNIRDSSGDGTTVYSWTWEVVAPTVAAQSAVDPVVLTASPVAAPPAAPGMHPGLPLMALVMALFAPVAAFVRRMREGRL